MFLYQKFGYDYKHIDISDKNKAISELAKLLMKANVEKPDFVCYDTETTGLINVKDKPFLISMGFNKTVITMDYDKEILQKLWQMYELPTKDGQRLMNNENYIGLFAHNAKYDYHMMINGGSPIPDSMTILDSITVARLTEYADETRSMSLESLGGTYVDEESKFAGKIIKELIKKENIARRNKLKKKIMEEFPDDGFFTITKTTGRARGTKKLTELIENYDKSRVNFVNNDDKYFKFIEENYKPANYEDIYKMEPELMRSYAADDIVIEIEYLNKAIPTIKSMGTNYDVMFREGALIEAVATMERTGLKVDIEYVLNCRKKMCDYRDLLYFELNMYTDKDFSVGQHNEIKKLLLEKYSVRTDKADEKALKYIRKNCKNEELEQVCTNILELRTLDKWISTYVDGKLNSLIYDEETKTYRIYTDINNNGAVSGRVSCNMQQQPKDGLNDRDGAELFHPRRMFITDDDYIFAFCDESQMELRVQANLTAEVCSYPDLAMSRAYMPYRCFTLDKGNEPYHFNYKDGIDKKDFEKYQWFRQEDDELWVPTDLHSETTSHAYPEVPMNDPKFKKLRKQGKTANFLRLYQGGVDALMDSLEVDRDTATKLNNAFDKAFPRVKEYQEWVQKQLSQYGYIQNLYGRRYYMNDSRWFYKGCNYLIQGTCADMVKVFEINVHRYLKENNLKSKMLLPIHDEIMMNVHKDEMFVIEEVKRIMEDVDSTIKYIPMISEPEVSYTNWASKEEYNCCENQRYRGL